ncbi:baseplate J/gp47 family protein [Lacrimispora celerecrescens]|uniref:baseplate J/gp47 family protein n=1 Tax=Lacrimispora celerecrescens TaxID=29354 RepID=UPI0016441948|nr:baseplate J/gp47 family protein [Lacrimispora celerecrescens]
MYEDKTYLNLLAEVRAKITDDIQTGEGSLVYNALSALAFEFEKMYIQMSFILNQPYADTADREYLIRLGKERKITPKAATYAELKGEFNMDIPIGSRFSLDMLNYAVIERLEAGVYRMRCEVAGTLANNRFGPLIPIDYINGLTKAELTELLLPGEEEETDKSLRERILTKLQKPSTGGNRYDYYNWALEVSGVGSAKVFPLAGGPGTVKVVIADSNRSAAGADLVNLVAAHIEGVRPIGASVSVVSAREKEINVYAGIKLKNGLNLGAAQNLFKEALTEYLQENAFDVTYISLAKVGNLLLNTAGVEDFTGLLINGVAENQELQDEEIAVPSTITLEVI